MQVLRNGDWNLIPVNELPKGKIIDHKDKFIFAEGEATNHFHTIEAEKENDFEIIEFKTELYIKVLNPLKITHPEHSLVTDLLVPNGIYLLGKRREKDWFSLTVRKIID